MSPASYLSVSEQDYERLLAHSRTDNYYDCVYMCVCGGGGGGGGRG